MENISMLKPLLKRGSEFLGVEYPIICGAMTWVSEPKLVSAVANAGAFACLAGGNAPTDILRSQIEEVKQRTKNNFAVNLITIAPSYHAHLEMMKDVKAPFIVFAGSFPKEKEIEAAKATGAKVMCFASTESIAERMRSAWCCPSRSMRMGCATSRKRMREKDCGRSGTIPRWTVW